VFLFILYSNHTERPPLFPTTGPRQPEMTAPTTPIFPLGGFRPPVFQFLAVDIPSPSTQPILQLGWDQMGLGDILATRDAPQHAEEVAPSQLTRTLVGTQPTQSLGGATSAAGGATRRAERHRMLQAHRRRP
jgi:hypothetical protein